MLGDASGERGRIPENIFKSRMRAYFSIVMSIIDKYEGPKIIAMGDGSAEWLSSLQNLGLGVAEIKVDLCAQADCSGMKNDLTDEIAIARLKAQPDNSQDLIFIFLAAVNITFESLQLLALQVSRVLKPGGIIIIEAQSPPASEKTNTRTSDLPPRGRSTDAEKIWAIAESSWVARYKMIDVMFSKNIDASEMVNNKEMYQRSICRKAMVVQKISSSEILEMLGIMFKTPPQSPRLRHANCEL